MNGYNMFIIYLHTYRHGTFIAVKEMEFY